MRFLLWLLLAGTTAVPCATAAAIERPNILVILSDDVPWGRIGYQRGHVATPNIDRISAEGVTLTQFYVQSVCTPTRSSFLTGRYPMHTGTQLRFKQTGGMLGDERTLADALAEVGYYTAVIGKWHLGNWEQKYLPLQRGFHHQYGCYGGLVDYYTRYRDLLDGNTRYDWHRNDVPIKEEGYVTDLIGDEAVRVIEGHDGSRPLFLYVPFTAAHSPYQAPREIIEKYLPAHRSGSKPLSELNATVDAQIHVMDQAVGRILAALEARSWLDDTIVFYFNDNGGVSFSATTNESWRGGKSYYYEGGIRVAAAIRWPKTLKSGTRVNEAVHVVDMYPTLVAYAGGSVDQPLPLDGIDIRKVIGGEAKRSSDEIVYSPKAIRIGDWKFIEKGGLNYSGTKGATLLFNIAEDPSESHDRAADKPELVARMRARLSELATTVRLPAPVERIPDDAWIYGKVESRDFEPYTDAPNSTLESKGTARRN